MDTEAHPLPPKCMNAFEKNNRCMGNGLLDEEVEVEDQNQPIECTECYVFYSEEQRKENEDARNQYERVDRELGLDP